MKTTYLIKIVLLLVFVFAGFYVYFALRYLKKKSDEKKKNEIILKTKTKSRKVYKAYKFLIKFKLTRKYLMRLQKVYEIRMPGDLRQAREKATKIAIIIWSISAVAVAGLLIFNPGYLAWATVLYTIYVVADQIVRNDVNKFDLKLIKELSGFIDDVRHQYFVHEMVDEALDAALEKTTPLMKLHGQMIYDIVCSDDMTDDLEKYCSTVPNYFMKMFADTCVKVMQFGDKVVDNQSLFLASIQSLKEEIQIELLKQNALANRFKALVWIAACPVYAIYPLKSFCINSFSPLKDLFNGSYGLFATIGAFVISLIIYKIVLKLRNATKVDIQDLDGWKKLYEIALIKKTINQVLAKNWGKTLRLRDLLRKTGSSFDEKIFTLKRCVYFCLVLVASLTLFIGSHRMNKELYGKNVTSVASTTSGASDDECFMMLVLARQLLEEHKDEDARKAYNRLNPNVKTMSFDEDVAVYLETVLGDQLGFSMMTLDEQLAYSQIEPFLAEHSSSTNVIVQLKGLNYEEAISSTDPMVQSGMNSFRNILTVASEPATALTDDERKLVAKEVTKQIRKYQNEYFHWYDFMISVGIALMAFNAPLWILKFEKKALQADMEDEIIQYKSSIMLLMHFEQMSIDLILESMQMLSRIFMPSIQKCINNLPLGEDLAFEQLIKDEPFDSFKRLVENLKMIDKVGVYKAFSTVSSERKNYQETRKQENEFNCAEKSALASFISMIPVYAVIILFMIVPFVYEAISEFAHAFADMQSFL